jgi:hypothetical protein
VVDQIADQFRESKKLVVAIGPSGTRKKETIGNLAFIGLPILPKCPYYVGIQITVVKRHVLVSLLYLQEI